MKKITLVAILGLVLLIFINPSKVSVFSNSQKGPNGMKEIKAIDIKSLSKYIKYNETLCLVDGNELKILDESGNELYKQDVKPDNINLSRNAFIDIVNKSINRCYSISEEGKVQFAIDLSPETFLYKSINKYVYVTVSKNNENEILKILNDEGGVTQRIDINGRVTNIKSIDDNILLSFISVSDKVSNKLTIYDQNGNIKKEAEFTDIILEIINMNDNVYLFFENKIEILDKNLKKRTEIRIDGITDIQECSSNIVVKNSTGEFFIIEDKEMKSIKGIKDKALQVKGIGNSYVLYSDKIIYNDKLKEIQTFEDKIKDIESISKDTIAIIFENSIKIYKTQ